MSPDGKWIWDGAQWRPIPVHEAAFPNWKGVGAGFVPEADTRAPLVTTPAAKRQAAPPASYRLAGPAPGVAAPNWGHGSRGAGIRRYAPIAVVAVGVLVLIVMVSVIGTLVLSNRGDQAPVTTVTRPTSGGPAARSASGQAAFVVKSLDGPMADLKDGLTTILQGCGVGMTLACEDGVVSIANKVTPILAFLDKATIPLCIATPETIIHNDFTKILEGQQLALKGFRENKSTEWLNGYAEVNAYGVRATNGFAVLKGDAASCDSALTGP